MEWLNAHTFLRVPARDWAAAALTVVAAYALLSSILRLIYNRLEAHARDTGHRFDALAAAVLRDTHPLFIGLAALLAGSYFIDLPNRIANKLDHVWFVIIGFQIALWLNRGVKLWARERLSAQSHATRNPVITSMVAWVLRFALWSMLMLGILANVGVNITAFVASLGVGGVAVALAVQNVLSDLFASLAIGLDKPFEIGDFIVVESIAGTVQHVGLKTTRIRSLSGEEIVTSNTALLKSTIHNYKRMSERRIVFTFGVTYDARAAQLQKIPEIVRRAVEAAGNTRFDRAHFKEFGENALNFEVVYFVTDPDFNLYMDIQQRINLSILEGLENLGTAFALPTRTIQLVRRDGEPVEPEDLGGHAASGGAPRMRTR
ncbi:mechanosensitive ion channel family protein [Ralstonia pickettii]|uniref:mechanosensitive ion channel family protein n=1 Tax=Ralstonia pickettii TaxID=329 RepID=UPI0015F88E70|nr:mechanosensitive ion channel family protein [Ralstonia pickettii]MBA9883123.1 mechanosensitive ion channel family protein [Ralstonia pickettii]MBA9892899.1 mechanosensitive ion channel family protein [Ralstonia pickettii]MBA9925086.1 mechanosensitive ion channel family protein [Ralstonia pickettii]MBB0093589.1 mechanosensitive ion channel family protein [Ralstonia pickettii]MBB0102700.1 mechanosensitive ion channel family protein [Ralstonia pickettii]